MKTSLFLVITLVASLLVSFSAAQNVQCLGYGAIKSLIKKGESCGGAIACEKGLYCDNTGICVDKKAVGDSCKDDSECPFGSECAGTTNTNKKCRQYVNPGEACKDDGSGPICGTGSCVADRCIGGNYGDGCKADGDCTSGKCSGGTCKSQFANGDACGGFCGFNQYCNTNGECAAGKTSGSCISGQCAAGYICLTKSFENSATSECVKRRSRVAGEWCYENSSVCAQSICHRGHCIEKSPISCGACVLGETCTCEDGILSWGAGVCKEDKCSPLFDAFWECIYAKCDSSEMEYSKSCANLSCKTEWDAYVACDPHELLSEFSSPT